MRAHALLSASGAHRWLHCTAAPRLEDQIKDKGSVYAREGTLAHDIGEAILNEDTNQIKELQSHELYYSGMMEEVEDYTAYCMERYHEMASLDPIGAAMYVEQRLDLTEYIPDGFGTGDCVIIGGQCLEVVDLKFGRGVVVDVEDNPQLMLYALGALTEFGFLYDIKKVRMTIAQVRTVGITSYEMDVKDLIYWGRRVVRPKAKEAYQGGSRPQPGDWCLFCRYKNNCKPRSQFLKNFVDRYQGQDALSKADIAAILDRSKEITSWIKELEEFALEEALKGVEFPGYKLVEGRSNRKIVDSEGLAKCLIHSGYPEDDIYKPRAIQNITNLEKLVGKKEFEKLGEGFVVKPKGKPTLATVDDKRPPYNSADDDFSE